VKDVIRRTKEVVTLSPIHLPPQKEAQIPTEQETGWVIETVFKWWQR
jgi:hypothetical protein